MIRTVRISLLALALALLAPLAHAQARVFPERTKLGALEVVVFPQARLDGKDVILAPGARILNEANMIVVPQSVHGKVQIRYRLDPLGQIAEAWILTPAELQQAKDSAAKEAAR